ncbi:hypothetical protein [Pedobacter sp. UYP1]|uniref:hypothetical protein n=1 Tax=Pedobacter sp. UYP1 TaxID=1756396 RepID=UPI00339AC76A
MFEEYKKEVLEFYFLKKGAQELSPNLENPGRSKLKKECLKIYAEKYTKKDDQILKLFFDPLGKFNDHIKSIEKFELDKFRPLVSFLQKGTGIRDEEPVKLLGWLTGFDSYQDWRSKKENREPERAEDSDPDQEDDSRLEVGDKEINDENENSLGDDSDGTSTENNIDSTEKNIDCTEKNIDSTEENIDSNKNADDNEDEKEEIVIDSDRIESPGTPVKATILTCVALLLLVSGLFFLFKKNTIRQPSAGEKCMYWAVDHYEPARCDEKIEDVTLIPINQKLLNNLRKINVIDTLTRYSLGKVWYTRVGGKHEFFTDSGMHPVDTLKRLRPLSNYILSNHVSHDRYLLNLWMWSISGIIAVMLYMICLIYFFRRQKKFKH